MPSWYHFTIAVVLWHSSSRFHKSGNNSFSAFLLSTMLMLMIFTSLLLILKDLFEIRIIGIAIDYFQKQWHIKIDLITIFKKNPSMKEWWSYARGKNFSSSYSIERIDDVLIALKESAGYGFTLPKKSFKTQEDSGRYP